MIKTEFKHKASIKEFVEYWKDKGYEKGESQPFWFSLLKDVFGVEHPEKFISFEDKVFLDNTSFIDGYIEKTKVLIEQKSLGKDLNKPIKQSDGTYLNPFQQAKRYITELPLSKHPRWVVTCNFSEFYVYDMERPNCEPEIIKLENLSKEYYRLQFLVDKTSEHIEKEIQVSIDAGKMVGLLYDALLKQYINPDNDETLKSLNILCVRLVFCLYAEDAGIFGKHNCFCDYLKEFDARKMRAALIDLFEVLDTKLEHRDPYLDESLASFPYVNGGLFAQKNIEIPNFTDEIKNLLINKTGLEFDWSQISPIIFGAVFESTLNPQIRRKGGMHYTSIENIHKVIDPLFMNDLKNEFASICNIKQEKTKISKLKELQNKIASLTFLDPACGSGNFLTETYISLRKLENEILYELQKGQIKFGLVENPIKVSISQFFGIEINDFAVTVAKTALWIAESQMLKETENIVQMDLDFLPLKTYANIVEGNALRIDWNNVISKDKLNYIMGNPPFVGSKYSNELQKKDMDFVFNNSKEIKYRTLDYVCCWYKKAVDYILNTNIKCAFVSTNSICQGEQVAILWKPLFKNGITINFAHTTFRWDSEASLKAHVYCVIIGFSYFKSKCNYLYTNNRVQIVDNINPFLIPAPTVFIESNNKQISGKKKMIAPNKPCDYNNLKIELSEYADFIKKCPQAIKWIKKMVGAQEFINNKDRYCLWLVGCSPKELKSMPLVLDRVEKCRQARLDANTAESIKLANTPNLFREQINPEQYLLIPCVSSEKRKYVPIGFLDKNTIPVMGVLIVPDASIYDFGILTSNVHMAWMRAVCGRLEMRYRYSKDIVYNNFPWCEPNDEQKAKIEKTAQAILDARALFPQCSLADLYDDLTMPPELRKAHQANDKAVMQAYNLDIKITTESSCVAHLMNLYQQKINEINKTKTK